MHTFMVVKEPCGWAVRVGRGMSTPFRSRSVAIQEAHRLCESLHRHGVPAEVVVDEIEFAEPVRQSSGFTADRLRSLLRSAERARRERRR